MGKKMITTHLWYVRLIRDGIYHPTDHGAVVEAYTHAEAEEQYKKVVRLDNGPEGEFAFYEPTAEVIEMNQGVGLL